MATREHDNDQPASPWSSTSVQLATLFVLMLLVVGIAIAIFHHGASPKTAVTNHPKGGAQTSPVGTTTSAAANPGSCSLPAGNQGVPSTSPPTGVTWAVVGSMSAPASATLGPQHEVHGVDVCFAHSPSGALLAAIDLWAEGSNQAVSPAVLFQTRAVGAPASLGNDSHLDSNGPVQLAGYQITSYSLSDANIEVVLQGPQGALLSVLTPLVWAHGDWKYIFPAGGVPDMERLAGTTLGAPYVPWSRF